MTLLALVVGLALGACLTIGLLGWRDRRERSDDTSSTTATGLGRLDTPRRDAAEEASLVRALHAVPIGIVVFEDGQSVFANRFARQFDSGRHNDALVEQAIGELVVRARSEGVLDDEVTLYGPPRRHLSLRALPLEDGESSGRRGILVTIEDTSERRRVEAVRRDFVANVSHELKTPVGAMGILAETLAEEEDSEVIQRLSERLHHEAFRLGTTIDDLLTLTTIESGETFEIDEVDLAEVIERSMSRVSAAADLRDITVTVEIASIEAGGDLVIRGDRRQLDSAISNLIDNAIKYSDEGAEVGVAAERFENFVDISVTDSGDGIPDRDLERIFERFYRVDQARSRSTGGTGLGLSIVRHVALNHGGKVSAESQEGVGSTFVLRLRTDLAALKQAEHRDDGEEVLSVG